MYWLPREETHAASRAHTHTERERKRQTDRDRETDRDRQRETDRERHRETETETHNRGGERNSNSKTVFYKDCSLCSVKTCLTKDYLQGKQLSFGGDKTYCH